MSVAKRKIGKVFGKGDRFGYHPNLFSACVNRALEQNRRQGKYIVPDKDLLLYARQVEARICRRFQNKESKI